VNIENLEAFVYVVYYNSFHKAAEALFLSQPSISARIQSLERELDVRLFLREGKTFSLTEQGKEFLPYAQQILQSLRKGKQQLRRNSMSLQEMTIGSTVSVSSYILPAIFPHLKERYPGMHIKLTTASTEAILEKVLQKEVDIGFVRNVAHPLTDSVLFYEDPIQLYVYNGHRFTEHPPETLEEIGGEPLVFFECGSLDWLKLHSLFETLQRPPVIDLYIDNLEMAKKCIAQGMGIGFLPDLCARQEVVDERLVPVQIPSLASLSLRTQVVTRKGEGAALRELFLDLIRTGNPATRIRLNVSINQ